MGPSPWVHLLQFGEDDLKRMSHYLKMAQTVKQESGKLAELDSKQSLEANKQMNQAMAGGSVPMAGPAQSPWTQMPPSSQDVLNMQRQFGGY